MKLDTLVVDSVFKAVLSPSKRNFSVWLICLFCEKLPFFILALKVAAFPELFFFANSNPAYNDAAPFNSSSLSLSINIYLDSNKLLFQPV